MEKTEAEESESDSWYRISVSAVQAEQTVLKTVGALMKRRVGFLHSPHKISNHFKLSGSGVEIPPPPQKINE